MSTATLTDARWTALRNQGFTGTTSDMLLQWLLANGATTAEINTAWSEMLAVQLGRPSTQVNDDWYELLGSLGFTQGHINDREYPFWLAGGAFAPGAPVWQTVPDFEVYETQLAFELDMSRYVSGYPAVDSYTTTHGAIDSAGWLSVFSAPGAYSITVTAYSPGYSAASNPFTLTILAGSPPIEPQWQAFDLVSIGPGDPVTVELSNYVVSSDPIDQYAIVSGPGSVDPATGTYSYPGSGDEDITIEVTFSARNVRGTGYSGVLQIYVGSAFHFFHDFTGAGTGPFVFSRDGATTSIDSFGISRSVKTQEAPFSGAKYVEGGGYSDDGFCHGLQVEHPSLNNWSLDAKNAAHWAGTGTIVTADQALEGYLPGIEAAEDTSTGVHSVEPSAVTAGGKCTVHQVGDRHHYITGFIHRGTSYRRYINVVSRLLNSTSDGAYDGRHVSICIDLKTWTIVSYDWHNIATDPDPYYYQGARLLIPLKDGYSAWYGILAYLDPDLAAGYRDLAVSIEGAAGPSAVPGQEYKGSGGPMCGWYGHVLEGLNNPDAPVPAAYQDEAYTTSWYTPLGGTRSNTLAEAAIPQTPGSRVLDIYAQCAFIMPLKTKRTREASNIMEIGSSGGIANGFHIKTRQWGTPRMTVRLMQANNQIEEVEITLSDITEGDVIDVRMMRSMTDGFIVAWAVNPFFDDPEVPGAEPIVSWNITRIDTAAVKNAFTLPVNYARVGNTVGQEGLQWSERIDVVHYRYGFSPVFTESDLLSLPIWTPPKPEVVVHPHDQEVPAA